MNWFKAVHRKKDMKTLVGNYVNVVGGEPNGANVYVCALRIKVAAFYANQPILLAVTGRYMTGVTFINIRFADTQTLDPNVEILNKYGYTDISVGIYKYGTSTWDVLVYCRAWASICVLDLKSDPSHFKFSYPNYYRPDVPSNIIWANVYNTTVHSSYMLKNPTDDYKEYLITPKFHQEYAESQYSLICAFRFIDNAQAEIHPVQKTHFLGGRVSSEGYMQANPYEGIRDRAWLQLPPSDNGGLLPCTPIDTGAAAQSQGHQSIGHSSWPLLHVYSSKIHPVEIIGSTDWMSIFVQKNGTNIGMQLLTNALIPLPDNQMHLGGAPWRWKQVHAVDSSISTSDKREKKEISYIGEQSEYETGMTDEQLITFMRGLRAVVFKRNPNDSNRPHHGFIAQDFEELLKETGLHDHAAFIKSPKTEIVEIEVEEDIETEVLDPDAEGGKRIEKKRQKVTKKKEVPIPDEYIYGMRYEELISDSIHFTQLLWDKVEKQRETIQEQQEKIENMEMHLAEIENIINLKKESEKL